MEVPRALWRHGNCHLRLNAVRYQAADVHSELSQALDQVADAVKLVQKAEIKLADASLEP